MVSTAGLFCRRSLGVESAGSSRRGRLSYQPAAARGEHHDGNSSNGLQGQITILISHRFSTVRMADQIVVLDAGLESGPTQPIRFSARQINWSMRIPQ